MKISAHTFITNPLSTGYYIYMPAIQSFLDFADEVVVVDGGSTDGSLDRLSELRGAEKIRVVSNDLTHWGPGDLWERPQFAVSREIGYRNCTGEWAICFETDHILPGSARQDLRQQLLDFSDAGLLNSFPLRRCRDGGLHPDLKKKKWWCVNKRLAEASDARIAWGIHTTGGNERPVYPVESCSFADPETGVVKLYWKGAYFPQDGTLQSRLDVYDHFFFSEEQMRVKLQRFENMRARWERRPPLRIAPDRRPYDLMSPEELLEKGGHSDCFAKHLCNFLAETGQARPDIYGLRRYRKPSWKRFIPGFR
jgi:glycosyltransferase involved in cell wall biosynthesis